MMGKNWAAMGRAWTAAVLALGVSACAAHGTAYPPPVVRGGLVGVEVYDRAEGTTLPVHTKDGRRYIVGTPGHEYALRLRNRTAARVLVVTSVDGVNVISGDTASPKQSGYVLAPWSSVEILGWRKSLERTAAFYFTEHRNSYAARTGRPHDVGVIGVAVFREKARPIARRDYELRRGEAATHDEAQAPGASSPFESSADAAPPAAAARERSEMARPHDHGPRRLGKLGTGHGRNEASHVSVVTFERASESPAETIAIRYDRRENLAAMGVLPWHAPHLTRREPEPFPGLRFTPDPYR